MPAETSVVNLEQRSFLFLQGPNTPFFPRLADRLQSAGHRVSRINFCSGDALFWGRRKSVAYRAPLSELGDFVEEMLTQNNTTHLVLFGDRRPVHRAAIERARALGIAIYVFEEGYLRPYRITLEHEGVNNHSLLPRDPQWYREMSARVPAPATPEAFHAPFRLRAAYDVTYHLAGIGDKIGFPNYHRHAPHGAPLRYAGYLRRFSMLRFIRTREFRRTNALRASGRPYYALPLQLSSDAQIRDHSPFSHMGEVIEHVIESFAAHAPADAWLAIKNHPLDYGFINYGRITSSAARACGVEGRVAFFEDGSLRALLGSATGVVTVNSTSGFVALELGRPTLALGTPLYHLPGLTFEGSLDEFWRHCAPPEPLLYQQFTRVLTAATQVNGGFYSPEGIQRAIANCLPILAMDHSPTRISLADLGLIPPAVSCQR